MNNLYLKFMLVTALFLLTRCGVIAVILSPSKQKKSDYNTSIPKVNDFQYSAPLGVNGSNYFKTQNLFIAEDSNCLYRELNSTLNCNLKQGYVFWPDGKCYAFGLTESKTKTLKEEELSGRSGYYYLDDDSIFIELFGSNGLGYGYYYYQGLLEDSIFFKLDKKNWYYREPKRRRKLKLEVNDIESIGFELTYSKDSSIVVKIDPIW